MIQLSLPRRVHAGILRRAAVEGAELADGVAVADLQARRLARDISCPAAPRPASELEDAVVPADAGVALDDGVRPDRVPSPISTCSPMTL